MKPPCRARTQITDGSECVAPTFDVGIAAASRLLVALSRDTHATVEQLKPKNAGDGSRI